MAEAKIPNDGIVTFLHMKVDQPKQEYVPPVYCQLTPQILQGTPELAASTLAKHDDQQQEESFLILSYWDSKEGYQQWETADEHRKELHPLVRLGHGLRAETFFRVC